MRYSGSSRQDEISELSRRRDTRLTSQKIAEFLKTPQGTAVGLLTCLICGVITVNVPLAGEFMLTASLILGAFFFRVDNRAFEMPFRVPEHAMLRDASSRNGQSLGNGIAYLGNDGTTGSQIYVSNSDLRTHQIVLGTTGSGKTEYLMGIMCNALAQNSGFIMVDGKGDARTQKDIFRLARTFGREDDLMVINFMTSGRDFVDKQSDKVTNSMNIMSNTSSGMLIELIVSLMDSSSSGDGDMWKGRAISFVAALTRVLVYLRDKGFIVLSAEKFIEYFELSAVEDLVYRHNGKYGERFDTICDQLRAYLISLPGYVKPSSRGNPPDEARADGQNSTAQLTSQMFQSSKSRRIETKTLEQHGYIVMQLTRIFNDLNFNYGHIFKTKVGDVDFYDVVLNRRLLCVLLPALERAPDTMKMLGKMVVGAIKQMMAGCLGNRVEGIVREIIDSRPTNSPVPYYLIFDEYGYYSVLGFAVAPAQGRSLGFCITFGAQDFESLKKSSVEEANATWENTNIRVIGRMTSGMERSETWEKVRGAAGEALQAVYSSFERTDNVIGRMFQQGDQLAIERRSRLSYDDIASQENGEFTFILGKKSDSGRSGAVHVVRGMGFYTAGPEPREIRLNDLLPVEPPEDEDALPPEEVLYEAFDDARQTNNLHSMLGQGAQPNRGLNDLKGILMELRPACKETGDTFKRAQAALYIMEKRIANAQSDAEAPPSDESKAEVNVQAAEEPANAPERVEVHADDQAEAPSSTPKEGEESKPEPTMMNEGGEENEDVEQRNQDDPYIGLSPVQSVLMKAADKHDERAATVGNSVQEEEDQVSDEDQGHPDVIIPKTDLTAVDVEDGDPLQMRIRRTAVAYQYRYSSQYVPSAADLDIKRSNLANMNELMNIESAASRPPESVEEYWARQDNAREIRRHVAESTEYIDAPIPERQGEDKINATLMALGEKCDRMTQRTLKKE